jgi:PAS domain S-box-containing protein
MPLMRWLSCRPVTLEHAAALWLVRRFVDPEADIEIVDASEGSIQTSALGTEVVGPTTRVRPFLRKYRIADDALAKRIEADVSRARSEIESGLSVSWAPELQAAWAAITAKQLQLEQLERCFDRHFGTASGAFDPDGLAREMLEVMPVGTMLLDANGTIRLANPKMGELVSRGASGLIGQSIQAVPLVWVDRNGHRVLEFSTLITSAIQHRRRYDRILTRSPHDLFLATSIQPVSSAQRPDPRLLITCVDATDQVLLEKAVQDREQRIHCLLNTLPFGVMEFTPDGEIVYANAGLHRMFGFSLGSLVGMPSWFTKGPAIDSGPIRERYRQMLERRQQPQPYISRVTSRTGGSFEVRVDWSYRMNADGSTAGFIAALSDLTEDTLRRTEFSRLLRDQTGTLPAHPGTAYGAGSSVPT